MKNVKFACKAGSADEESVEDFKKYLLSVIWENRYVEESVFNADENGLFYSDISKETYRIFFLDYQTHPPPQIWEEGGCIL